MVEPGRVLFAKNSDRDPNEAQLLTWQPAADHEPGTTLRATWIEIPQARHTHAVLLSRPFWMWGAEMGANEHGVVIGNEAVYTRRPLAKVGLTGMDLLRLALERSATAADAVQTVIDLLGAHGQGGGCGHEHRSASYHNSFLVADATEAWVLETADRQWAVERVGSGVRSISNGLTIDAFARAHADRLRSRVGACVARRACTETGAARARGAEPGPALAALAATLRDHGTDGGEPRYGLLAGGVAAPCMHAGGLATSSTQTTASWMSELRPDGARHWVTATAAPCTGLFKPVCLDEPLGPDVLGHQPGDVADTSSLWWRHERLHRRVVADYRSLVSTYATQRDAVETAWFADPPEPAEAFLAGDKLLAEWTERVAATGERRDTRPPHVRRFWAVRNRRAGLDLASAPQVRA